MSKIDKESALFGDLVQGDFHDSYDNLTMKTISGMRWAVENCPESQFYFLVDDDQYVSPKNLLRFLHNSIHFPRCAI